MIKCFYNNTDRPDCICTEEGYGIISQIEPDSFIPQRDHIHPSAGDDVFGNSVKVPEGQELIYNGKPQVGVKGGGFYTFEAISKGVSINENGDAVATDPGTYQAKAKNKGRIPVGDP